ncbi:NAD-dependent protein deacylase sirtuin-6-like isoform X2 [Halichondria panicea]|uniref:NAD-dependent protein deacylase sirtuin-6-like isoform X2 n=1 Tax=Halichondria panicea TaxID=6063 RepID=UPI00312BA719
MISGSMVREKHHKIYICRSIMASTIREEDETKEFFDSPEELKTKVSQLADWIRQSKHFIAFTGAGISTSAGIPDFRSGIHTKLGTGPGKWELRAKGVGRDAKKHKTTTTVKAIPTPTHMSIVQLVREGILHAVVSQNCDGLHRRSGLITDKLYELHGNSNVEKCCKCKKEYLRDFRVRTAVGARKHKTGRKCDNPACRGDLKDTIINFGENLPEVTLDCSFEHAKRADLCLAMGSSLTVTPAADIPETTGKKKGLVIVNLQRTPLDHLAAMRINGKCDDVMKLLMSKLGLDIPEFRLKRCVVIKANHKHEVCVEGRDQEDHPFSFLKSVTFSGAGPDIRCDQEPYTVLTRAGAALQVNMAFHSHYGEPPLMLKFNVAGNIHTHFQIKL